MDVVLDAPHNEALRYHDWVFLGGWRGNPVTVLRDARGRRHRHAWREWLVLSCNNSDCPARALVRMDIITATAQAALPVPTTTDATPEGD